MVTRSDQSLSGQRNQCPACGELFRSNAAFDKHRVGKFGVNRRCATASEMEASGMVRRGLWWVSAINPAFAPVEAPSAS